MKKPKIIFYGTPDFAVSSLDALLKNNYEVVAVVTAPDKPAGRGYKLQPSDVKKYALENNLPLFQPTNLKSEDFQNTLKELAPDLGVVVAFRMMPESVWNFSPLGTINVHASLLPNYRGAAPIHWAIINGEKETGVTTFKLKHQIDTGDILLQKKVEILPNETTGELYDRLKDIGAELLVETISNIETIKETPQNLESPIKLAPKITKEQAIIDFSKSGQEIINLINGMNPYPLAWFLYRGEKLVIASADFIAEKHNKEIGSYDTDHKNFLYFYCQDGKISIKKIRFSSSKLLLLREFLIGSKIF